jgi:hypothetical protein
MRGIDHPAAEASFAGGEPSLHCPSRRLVSRPISAAIGAPFVLAGETVGGAVMRWAPLGGFIVAKWDYVVNND